jgi:hypothetical protein
MIVRCYVVVRIVMFFFEITKTYTMTYLVLVLSFADRCPLLRLKAELLLMSLL